MESSLAFTPECESWNRSLPILGGVGFYAFQQSLNGDHLPKSQIVVVLFESETITFGGLLDHDEELSLILQPNFHVITAIPILNVRLQFLCDAARKDAVTT